MAGSLPVAQPYRHQDRTGSRILLRAFIRATTPARRVGETRAAIPGQPVGTSSSRYSIRVSTAPRLETNGQVRLRAQSSAWSA